MLLAASIPDTASGVGGVQKSTLLAFHCNLVLKLKVLGSILSKALTRYEGIVEGTKNPRQPSLMNRKGQHSRSNRLQSSLEARR